MWKYSTPTIKCIEQFKSELTGISVHGVNNIQNEIRKNGKLVTPHKKRSVTNLLKKFDEYAKNSVCLKVHALSSFFHFFLIEPPTLNKILSVVHNDPKIPI